MNAGTRRGAQFAAVAAGVVLLDQLSKAWAVRELPGEPRRPLVGDLLGLQLTHNSGAAFSLGTSMTWVLTLVAVGLTVAIVVFARRLRSTAWAVAAGLLLGGAIGNLIDRLTRPPGFARGEVVDFIAYGNWFIGNVADIAIVAAACLVVILVARGVPLTGAPGASGSAAADGGGETGEAGERP